MLFSKKFRILIHASKYYFLYTIKVNCNQKCLACPKLSEIPQLPVGWSTDLGYHGTHIMWSKLV